MEGNYLTDFVKVMVYLWVFRTTIAMIGRDDLPDRMEKVGRFGEKIILEATAMGLSTCWAGTSYDKKAAMTLY